MFFEEKGPQWFKGSHMVSNTPPHPSRCHKWWRKRLKRARGSFKVYTITPKALQQNLTV
jgi:hypothetical protein